jgi:hypothetical protein
MADAVLLLMADVVFRSLSHSASKAIVLYTSNTYCVVISPRS